MKTIATFNALHLGDNLIHLHFLRKLAALYPEIQFTHGAPAQYLAQLAEMVGDLPNLRLTDIAQTGQGAINAWRGAGGWFYQQPDQHDFVSIHLRWFRHLAREMGLESPITCAADMLFDYPALRAGSESEGESERGPIDFLIVNSPPQSGQWSGWDYAAFSRLIDKLPASARIVTTHPVSIGGIDCTQSWPGPSHFHSHSHSRALTVTGIGALSCRARVIIGCVTGPMWPTLNVWNRHTVQLRVHLLDHERVDIIPDRTVHANSLSLVPEILKDRGLL